MEAGFALDMWIITDIMRWNPGRVNNQDAWFDQEGNRAADISWSPSTDIAAALEVVPRVLAEWDATVEGGYEAEFNARYHPDWWGPDQTNRGPRWWAALGSDDDYEGTFWRYEAWAPELPHAICLAALKVKKTSA